MISITLFAAGSFVETLNEHKIADPDKSAIRDELASKLKSGEIQANNDLVLMFVESNQEIDETTSQFVSSILEVIKWTGLIMMFLLVLQAVLFFRFVNRRKARGESQSLKAE